MPVMGRREFMTLLAGAAAWPLAARAQQPAMPVVGYLSAATPDASAHLLTAFRAGMSEAGYVEGRNIAIEYRWAGGQYDQLAALAGDLVSRRVTVIAVIDTPATLAAQAATRTIPIVFGIGGDPVELGLVASFNRPGGNLTGVSFMNVELGGKLLELIQESRPAGTRFAALVNPSSSLEQAIVRNLKAAAVAIGKQIEILTASTPAEIDAAFARLAQKRADALVITPDSFFTTRRVQLALLAAHHSIPAIYTMREFPEVGGLMSYGARFSEHYRQVGSYTARILKGERAADLPIARPTKFEFVINLRTAKLISIEIPTTLLARADEVIE